MKNERGFTLLELLVATTVMAIAVVGLLAALTTSLRNAAKVTANDRAALVAKRKMEELLVQARLPRFEIIQGPLTPATDAGLEGGWSARMTPFEVPPNANPGLSILERLELEIWWKDGDNRRTFKLDGYRPTVLDANDMMGVVGRQ